MLNLPAGIAESFAPDHALFVMNVTARTTRTATTDIEMCVMPCTSFCSTKVCPNAFAVLYSNDE